MEQSCDHEMETAPDQGFEPAFDQRAESGFSDELLIFAGAEALGETPLAGTKPAGRSAELEQVFAQALYDFPQQGRILASGPLQIPGWADAQQVLLYLPPQIEVLGCRFYELAYVFGATRLFDGARQSLTEEPEGWQLHRLLDTRTSLGLPTPVVLGLPDPGPDLARGEALLGWVRERLQPWLIEHLPLLEGPEHCLLIGEGSGARLALAGCLQHAGSCGRALALGPELGDDELLSERARQLENPLRCYLDTSREPGLGVPAGRFVERLSQGLEARGLELSGHLCWLQEADPAAEGLSMAQRLSRGLEFFYGAGIVAMPPETQAAA